MIIRRRDQGHAGSQADLFGALTGSRQKTLRGRRIRVLLQKVVFDFPEMIDTGAIRAFDAVQSFFPRPMFRIRSPGLGKLKKFKIAELQRDTPEARLCRAALTTADGANLPHSAQAIGAVAIGAGLFLIARAAALG